MPSDVRCWIRLGLFLSDIEALTVFSGLGIVYAENLLQSRRFCFVWGYKVEDVSSLLSIFNVFLAIHSNDGLEM